MNIKQIATLLTAVILGFTGSAAVSQELLMIEGAEVSDVIDLFGPGTMPEGWEDAEAADPNGRPLIDDSLQRFVTLNTNFIETYLNPDHKTPFRINLQILEDLTITMVIDDIQMVDETRYVSGRVESDDLSRLSLAITKNNVRGTLHFQSRVIEFRIADGSTTAIQWLNPKRFPKERGPLPAHRQPGFDASDPQPFGNVLVMAGGDGIVEPFDGEAYAMTGFEPPEFTVLGVFSRDDFPDKCDADSLDLESAAYTKNLTDIYGDYAIGTVTFECVDPPDTEVWTTLEEVRQYLMVDPVKALRIAEEADLVVMIVKDGLGYCGYAMHPDYPKYPIELYGDQYKSNAAFAVVDESCALPQSSFAHEIGHLLGMKHERFNQLGGVDNFCGYGYPVMRMRRPIAQTVMAYDDYCDYRGVSCSRVPYFSIPRKQATGAFSWFQNAWNGFFGRTKGQSCESTKSGHLRRPANNTSQLINSAKLVAQYSDPP
ncbi:MAG: zinc-dependent metalloprotease family protein [Woeseiaceae bacterium]|nr:zinc-dependent metalloprotease family protein [Woeseiaceae bacterium]MDX2608540.1 zinc-dependent metalloprotease family protein [Woeseiaceae bacterium]